MSGRSQLCVHLAEWSGGAQTCRTEAGLQGIGSIRKTTASAARTAAQYLQVAGHLRSGSASTPRAELVMRVTPWREGGACSRRPPRWHDMLPPAMPVRVSVLDCRSSSPSTHTTYFREVGDQRKASLHAYYQKPTRGSPKICGIAYVPECRVLPSC